MKKDTRNQPTYKYQLSVSNMLGKNGNKDITHTY